ncbi:hypothetical protein [Streptomyces sp. 2112.3]|uniref:hypothetical protein n=1 Tax=Streptomyces sp. 2112.3 TaxID=1881023 RepID=UPI00115FE0A1|nr:hypothetical protein [Streptomyces sp. 2112.3]
MTTTRALKIVKACWLSLPPLRNRGRAQQVGVVASSWNADDDDEAGFGFAEALDGFDPDAVEKVDGAFGVDGLVQREQDGEAGVRV